MFLIGLHIQSALMFQSFFLQEGHTASLGKVLKPQYGHMSFFFAKWSPCFSFIILPSLRSSILSVRVAIWLSWVTTMMVVPWLRFRLASNLTSSCLFFVSKFPVGSSANSIAGSLANALAIAHLLLKRRDLILQVAYTSWNSQVTYWISY